MIQNKRAVLQVLGTVINDPTLLLNENYELTLDDFQESVHRVIFLAVNKLMEQNVTSITGITIDNYLSTYPTQYKVFQDNRGVELVDKLMSFAQKDAFDYWYQMLKKFTLLREFRMNGFDISTLYNENETDVEKIEVANARLSQMTTQDIVDHFNEKFLNIKEKWTTNIETDMGFKAGDGMRSLKERLKTTPSMGHSFVNPILTTALRGMRRKKFVLVSGSSGSGKSRTQMANAVHVATPWLYNTQENKWEKRNEESKPVLYISTELEQDEIQTVMIAYLSGVDEEHILTGEYGAGEEERVDRAIEILEQAPLYCQYIADFDIKDIESLIERMIVAHKIEYVFYDYLHSTPKILQYYNQATGTRLAEHQILYLFGNSLKMLVNKYDIFLYSSTQLNRNYKDEQNLDASAIRGALSLSDKLDAGIISIPPSAQDLEYLKEAISQNWGIEPNMCHTIYKNRGSRYKSIRIWTRINLGNVREKVLFVTDDRYRKIEMKETYIETMDDYLIE